MLDAIELDNGLKIYLVCDNNKHTAYANLIVKFGGSNSEILINNKRESIKSGTAHFLEHLVLECSIYGDLMNIFGSRGIRSNGLTSIDRTLFYIDTVTDIYENLELLIKGIHSPIINKKNIELLKEPILAEKRRSLDNKYSELYNTSMSNILRKGRFKSVLGDIKDISSMNESDLKKAYNAFYRPENEVIVIGGNFDKEKIINTIKNSYSNIEFSNDIIKDVKYKNIDKVNKKYTLIKDDINIEKSIISFKINIENMDGYDKLLLDTYLYFFLRTNFGVSSNLNKELINKNIIIGNIGYSTDIIDESIVVRIESNIKDEDYFNNIILDYLVNKKYKFDKDLFELYKKNFIIDYITRCDDIYRTIDPLIENIITFGYEGIDSISDIEKLNYNDYKKTIEKLYFNNYSISVLKMK